MAKYAVPLQSVIESSFYRSDFNVTYNLSLNKTTSGTEYVDVQINISYKARRMRDGIEKLPVIASLLLSDDTLGATKFTSFKVGTLNFSEKDLSKICVTENEHLVVRGIPEQDVPMDQSLKVVFEGETAFPLESSFEAFIMSIPATGLTIKVIASEELIVALDTLHPSDMQVVPNADDDNEYQWIQRSGLVAGQGAIIRWRKK